MASLLSYFRDFEKKYSSLVEIDANWYMDELGVKSYCTKSSIKDKNGNFLEEWYRARFVYLMVNSGYYSKNQICVELSLPKGNGGKAIQPDIVVFRSRDWINWLASADFETIRKNILLVLEVKNNSDNVEKAIEKQIEVALERRLSSPDINDWAYGIYLDNQEDIVILKKEGTAALERYDVKKMIKANKNIDMLNVALRDNLESLPSYKYLEHNVENIETKHQFTYADLSALGEQGFQSILDYLHREKDKLQVPMTKELLVEALTLKVFDEKNIKGTTNYSKFYIADNEINNRGYATQPFRHRINELFENAKNSYTILNNRSYFSYKGKENLTPNNGDDEKMFIAIVKAFQGKGILEGTSENFNQIIFNNFGDEVEKSVAGQFFTPIPIIEAIVKIIKPQEGETIADPCAGICDFLAMSWRYSNSQGDALNYYGFDISPTVLKLAELNLVLNGDGNANIHKCNTIFEKLCKDDSLSNVETFTPDNYEIDDWTSIDDSKNDIKQFDVVMTNPPFGKGRDLKTGKNGKWDYGLNVNNMKMYETWVNQGTVKQTKAGGVSVKYPMSIDMGIIFLENAYKMTKPGGRMAIVLSNSIVSIPTWEKVRKWFMKRVRLVAILDMPQNSFGETGVATTVLIAYKPKSNEMHLLASDYEVFIKEIQYTGYEVKTVQRSVVFEPIKQYDPTTFQDTGKLREDFTETLKEFNEYMKRQEREIKIIFGRE